MKVYQAINSVQAELCKIGIAKDSRNTQGLRLSHVILEYPKDSNGLKSLHFPQ